MSRVMIPVTALALGASLLCNPVTAVAKDRSGPHCPPGLAKKSPTCVPPGLADKGGRQGDVRDEDRDEYTERYDEIRVGDRVVLDGNEYTVVKADGDRVVLHRDDTLYRLPRIGDGSEYVRLGDVIVKVDRKTRAALQIIELADLILS